MINNYINDLCWFSVNLVTLRVNRDTFEAFVWRLKNYSSANHSVLEERSALEDTCVLSLHYAVLDQNNLPEYQPDWITRINNLIGSEGVTLRKRLKFNITRAMSSSEDDTNGSLSMQIPNLSL